MLDGVIAKYRSNPDNCPNEEFRGIENIENISTNNIRKLDFCKIK